MTSSLMVLLAVALQTTPTPNMAVAVVDIQTVGFTENNSDVKKRVIDEIKEAGFAPKNRMDQKAECLETPSCREGSTEELLMAFTITKVASSFQVAVKMASKDGSFTYDQTHYSQSAQKLLDDKWTQAWRAHSTPTKSASQNPTADTEPGEKEVSVKPKSGRAWWGYSGLGLSGLGAVLLITGGSLATADALTLRDPDSSGAEKTFAKNRGPVALGVAGAGTLAIGVGVALFFLSASDHE